MKWRLFKLLSALCLLLAALVLLERLSHPWYSHRCHYATVHTEGSRIVTCTYSITSGNGVLAFVKRTLNVAGPPNYTPSDVPGLYVGRTSDVKFNSRDGPGFLGPMGFSYGGFTYMGGISSSLSDETPVIDSRDVLVLPSWFVALILVVLAIVFHRPFRRIHPPGLCQVCGYDLRASKERCPECGTPFGAATSITTTR